MTIGDKMEMIAIASVVSIVFVVWMLVKESDDFDDGYDKGE